MVIGLYSNKTPQEVKEEVVDANSELETENFLQSKVDETSRIWLDKIASYMKR